MNHQQDLINGITKCQKEKRLTDVAFAKIVGVNFSMVHCVKQGKRQPGMKVIKGLARNFPELHELIINYLADGNKTVVSFTDRIKRYFGRLNL